MPRTLGRFWLAIAIVMSTIVWTAATPVANLPSTSRYLAGASGGDGGPNSGGVVAATESGWVHRELARGAFEFQRSIENGERTVVGLNAGLDDAGEPGFAAFDLPPGTLEEQLSRLDAVRRRRDAGAAARAIEEVAEACRGESNVMPAVLGAVEADVTLGELGRTFRDTLGRWDFPLW